MSSEILVHHQDAKALRDFVAIGGADFFLKPDLADEVVQRKLTVVGLSVLGIMSGYEKAVSTFAEYGQKLHEVTDKICVAIIESFV
ncbi:MAG: hypothetical protein WBC22_13410 [Sedimentisphaerales bacterium]